MQIVFEKLTWKFKIVRQRFFLFLTMKLNSVSQEELTSSKKKYFFPKANFQVYICEPTSDI